MKIARDISFINFVYPFLFDANTMPGRVRAIDQAYWQPREGQSLKVWVQRKFPEKELLTHVARYLNPTDDTSPTARLWELAKDPLQFPSGLGRDKDWALVWRDGEVPFRLESLQLILFGVGIGFITACVKPRPRGKEGQALGTDDWLNLLHYFRFARQQRDVRIKIRTRTGPGRFSPFFPEPAGGLLGHPEGIGGFLDVLDALIRTGSTELDSKAWWREVFISGELLPFATLYVDEVDEKEIPTLTYRLRNFFHARQEIVPTPGDLRLENDPGLLPYANSMWFIFSLDGGAFVAYDAPTKDFFRGTLPNHLQNEYFLLLILALHQRFALMELSEDVAKSWPVGSETSVAPQRKDAFDLIRDRLLQFTARGYFAQVMQREHPHRCYRKWQEVFQVERLYQEVKDEVGEMYNWLLMKQNEQIQQWQAEENKRLDAVARQQQLAEERSRRLEWWLGGVAAFLGPTALALSYLDALGVQSTWDTPALGIVVGLVAGAILFTIGGKIHGVGPSGGFRILLGKPVGRDVERSEGSEAQ
ncbi:MAG: hypothetical protein HY675_13250 [Chloroflexi bacterium]|nr:hypothetical protein [Chloroflexota bacterium]